MYAKPGVRLSAVRAYAALQHHQPSDAARFKLLRFVGKMRKDTDPSVALRARAELDEFASHPAETEHPLRVALREPPDGAA